MKNLAMHIFLGKKRGGKITLVDPLRQMAQRPAKAMLSMKIVSFCKDLYDINSRKLIFKPWYIGNMVIALRNPSLKKMYNMYRPAKEALF